MQAGICWNILIFICTLILAFVSVPPVIKLALKIKAVDRPEKRKVHSRLMPRLGGLAIFVPFTLVMALMGKFYGPYTGIILGGSIIFLVGALDDIFGLSAWVKLGGQIIAALVAIHYGVIVHFVTNPFDGYLDLGMLSLPLTLLWIVGVSNAINLIDGLDGLAAGVSAIAAITMGIIAFNEGLFGAAGVALILVAAILGFLPYNFYPAQTFMGDGGSNFLGFILACMAVMGTAKSAALISLLVPLVILGIPIFDTFFAIIRRIHKKQPIFSPDKDHLHHRLMALGVSHRRTVLIIYAISIVFGAISVTMTFISGPKALMVIALLMLAVVLGAGRIGLMSGGKNADAQQVGKPRGIEF
ncbi:MAG: glycosyltransferase family 4 protein [Syntrophomonadaceae bacterium]